MNPKKSVTNLPGGFIPSLTYEDGEIYVKKKRLGLLDETWQKKKYIVDLEQKVLVIKRKSEKKKPKIYELQKHQVKYLGYLGKKIDKYQLDLLPLDPDQKKLSLSMSDEKFAEMLFNTLMACCRKVDLKNLVKPRNSARPSQLISNEQQQQPSQKKESKPTEEIQNSQKEIQGEPKYQKEEQKNSPEKPTQFKSQQCEREVKKPSHEDVQNLLPNIEQKSNISEEQTEEEQLKGEQGIEKRFYFDFLISKHFK